MTVAGEQDEYLDIVARQSFLINVVKDDKIRKILLNAVRIPCVDNFV